MSEVTWIDISAVASAAVAVATGFLARYTYDLAKETRRALDDERSARRAEERRHIWMASCRILLSSLKTRRSNLQGLALYNGFLLYAQRIIGAGFAQNIRLIQLNLQNESQFFIFNPPVALAAGDDVLLAAKNAGNPITFMGCSVSYDDAFGRHFESSIADDIAVGSRYTWQRPPA